MILSRSWFRTAASAAVLFYYYSGVVGDSEPHGERYILWGNCVNGIDDDNDGLTDDRDPDCSVI